MRFKKNKKQINIKDWRTTDNTIVFAKVLKNFRVLIIFKDKKRIIINIKQWLENNPYPIYDDFRKEENFKEYFNWNSTSINWGNDLDFYSDSLYPYPLKDRIYKFCFPRQISLKQRRKKRI
jgi:hypothetical protein